MVCNGRETLTVLGPSFIKAGQVLASRPDIVREDYMNELCILQARRQSLAIVSDDRLPDCRVIRCAGLQAGLQDLSCAGSMQRHACK